MKAWGAYALTALVLTAAAAALTAELVDAASAPAVWLGATIALLVQLAAFGALVALRDRGPLFLLGWLLYLLHPILSPFLIGILLAYLGDPLVDRLERLRLSRGAGVLVVFALFGLALLLALLVVVPMFGRQLARLYQLAPQMLDWLQGTALPWSQAQLGSAGPQ